MYRKNSYNEMMATTLLKSVKARKGYLLADIEEDDFDVIGNLKDAINYMGIKEFAQIAKLQTTSVSRFVNSDEVPKFSTLEKFFSPFGVKPKLSIEQVA